MIMPAADFVNVQLNYMNVHKYLEYMPEKFWPNQAFSGHKTISLWLWANCAYNVKISKWTSNTITI